MKRGSTQTLGFLIGILVSIAIIVAFIPACVTFFSGAGEQKLIDAKAEFDNISKFYRSCAENPKGNCFCGSFSVAEIRKLGYNLYLNKHTGQSHLLLVKFGVYPDADGLFDKDDIAVEASFGEELVCTFGYDGFTLKDTAHRFYGVSDSQPSYIFADKIPVLKTDSKLCVFDGLKADLEALMKDYAGCDAALDSDKLILLDSSDDPGSRQIAAHLSGYLLRDAGRVDYFFIGEHKDRVEWFGSVYVNEKDDYLASKLFLIHLDTSLDAAPASEGLTDSIIVHYLQDSVVGEAFAKAVGLKLANLKGKYYHNSVDEAAMGTVPENSRFNTEVVYEANSMENPDNVYLVCGEDELPVCKEKLQVPAVFIEVIDADDGYSAYQGHEEILARAISDGVLDYIKYPAVYEYVPKASDEPLFQ